MTIHYAVKHLGKASDISGVNLWLASETERKTLHALELHTISAPAEVPCPTGLAADPASPCNRDNAFARLAPMATAETRARADALLASCGTTLAAYTSRLSVTTNDAEHFLVPSSCASDAPFEGIIRVVHARMQTRGASVHVDAERNDGTWESVIDIPAWRWAWDGAYVLEHGVPIHAGRKVRVACTFDNGTAGQWSALTGEPGHDAPARPPLLPAQYVVRRRPPRRRGVQRGSRPRAPAPVTPELKDRRGARATSPWYRRTGSTPRRRSRVPSRCR